MTDKQIERVKAKIATYKKALAADKKHWGGYYHDGKGIRYIIPEQFIKIKDYKGGLRYFNWFDKNFPDDSGNPHFLFEWAFILFKCQKIIEAEKKVQLTFFSNIYLFDKFLGNAPLIMDYDESAPGEIRHLDDFFPYSSLDIEFNDFAVWTAGVLNTSVFLDKVRAFHELERKLLTEPVGRERTELVNKLWKLKYG